MVVFKPHEYSKEDVLLVASTGEKWSSLYWHECGFPPDTFAGVMLNLIRNPNINSNHLFRADILFESSYPCEILENEESKPRIMHVEGFELQTVIVRRLIPRKPQLDKALDQTCLIYTSSDPEESRNLVIYLPHIISPSECPFYHPPVQGIAFLHEYRPQTADSVVSLHFSFFDELPRSEKLERIAQHLLATVHKHGQGQLAGYTKRVHHDVLLPQAVVQNTYSRLKTKYAKTLIQNWAEVTDPTKHVFEDLSIAAFLIELWNDMYGPGKFPGFVDIGCGNGLLVHILREEGYTGWGFDARRRKSWETYPVSTKQDLKEAVLIPAILQDKDDDDVEGQSLSISEPQDPDKPSICNGIFAPGTFIISNHADELTPWTPLLATLNSSPFLIIPCCSHNLTGARFRAAPPKIKKLQDSEKDKSAPQSQSIAGTAYAALVAWVAQLAEDCGWVVEKEMLRIPSTRNTGLVGRNRTSKKSGADTESEESAQDIVTRVLHRYGGAAGWAENALKLVKSAPKAH